MIVARALPNSIAASDVRDAAARKAVMQLNENVTSLASQLREVQTACRNGVGGGSSVDVPALAEQVAPLVASTVVAKTAEATAAAATATAKAAEASAAARAAVAGYVKVVEYSVAYTAAADVATSFTFDATLSSYTPVGVVALATNRAKVVCVNAVVGYGDENTVRFSVLNVTSTAISGTFRFRVMYLRSDSIPSE